MLDRDPVGFASPARACRLSHTVPRVVSTCRLSWPPRIQRTGHVCAWHGHRSARLQAMPPRTRQTFQQQIDAVEEELQNHARLVMRALDRAMQALLSGDEQLADMVVAEDDENDAAYARIEARARGLLALQSPLATDLRLILAMLHINLHLERMGDQCVNIAKLTKLTLKLMIATELRTSFAKS